MPFFWWRIIQTYVNNFANNYVIRSLYLKKKHSNDGELASPEVRESCLLLGILRFYIER